MGPWVPCRWSCRPAPSGVFRVRFDSMRLTPLYHMQYRLRARSMGRHSSRAGSARSLRASCAGRHAHRARFTTHQNVIVMVSGVSGAFFELLRIGAGLSHIVCDQRAHRYLESGAPCACFLSVWRIGVFRGGASAYCSGASVSLFFARLRAVSCASALLALSVGIGRLGRVQSSLGPRAACVIGRRVFGAAVLLLLLALSVGIGRLGRVQQSLGPRAARVIGRRFLARPCRMRFCVRPKNAVPFSYCFCSFVLQRAGWGELSTGLARASGRSGCGSPSTANGQYELVFLCFLFFSNINILACVLAHIGGRY